MKQYKVGLAAIMARLEGVEPHPLLNTISDHWTKIQNVWVENIDLDIRERIHDALDATAACFQDAHAFLPIEIMSVVTSHISIVLSATEELQLAIHAPCHDEKDVEGKLMKFYFEKVLPRVAGDGPDSSDDAKDDRSIIWSGLMFRMICWFLLHDFDRNDINRMDSALKGSRMPVFIG